MTGTGVLRAVYRGVEGIGSDSSSAPLLPADGNSGKIHGQPLLFRACH